MKGYIYITSSGYDPEQGLHLKDPYLGTVPTMGACRPDIRRQVVEGDHIFVVSGKIKAVPQYVIGGFEVGKKIDMLAAYARYPELRLRKREDGQLTGNIIVNSSGNQHHLDNHAGFERRIANYIIGRNPLVLTTPEAVARGREGTLRELSEILGREGKSPIRILGRAANKLDSEQVKALRNWLATIQ